MLFKTYMKPITFAIIMIITIILIIHINAINKKNNILKELELLEKSTNPVEVLEKHLMYKKQNRRDMIYTTMTHHNRNMDLNLDNISFFEVIEIAEKKDELTQSYIDSLSPFEVTSFDVTFEIKYHEEKENNNGIYTYRYIIIKEEKNDPWLVYTWGINF